MKKIIVLVLALVALQQAYAQKSELSVSYGYPSNRNVDAVVGDMGTFLGTGMTVDDDSFSGVINVEYMYRLSDRFAIGLDLGYEHGTGDLQVGNTKMGKRTDNYYAVMAGGKYYWKNGSMFRMYAKVAAGIDISSSKYEDDSTSSDKSENESSVDFAYQVSPIAFEVGKSFCGFVELGYGNQGVAQAGIRIRF